MTGRQREPEGEKKGGVKMEDQLSFIRDKGESSQVLNAARQLQEENA